MSMPIQREEKVFIGGMLAVIGFIVLLYALRGWQ